MQSDMVGNQHPFYSQLNVHDRRICILEYDAYGNNNNLTWTQISVPFYCYSINIKISYQILLITSFVIDVRTGMNIQILHINNSADKIVSTFGNSSTVNSSYLIVTR